MTLNCKYTALSEYLLFEIYSCPGQSSGWALALLFIRIILKYEIYKYND